MDEIHEEASCNILQIILGGLTFTIDRLWITSCGIDHNVHAITFPNEFIVSR